MIRWLRITLLAVLAAFTLLVLLLTSTLVWVTATESGAQYAWREVRTFLPPGVEIRALEGRVAGPLEIRGLKISTADFELEMDRITLEWHPLHLLKRVLKVEYIALEGVRYTQLGQKPEKSEKQASPASFPEQIELPLGLSIHLGEASMRDFEFRSRADGTSFGINYAMLNATLDKQRADISKLKVESPLFRVEGNTLLTTRADFPIEGELKWRVPVPDYPAVHGHTLLSGDLREITITQSIAAPYTIEGTVLLLNPVEKLVFEASLDVNALKLQALRKDFLPLTAQMAITGKGTLEHIIFSLDGWVEEPRMGRVNTELDGRFKSNTLTLDALNLHMAEQPAQATARGQIEFAATPKLDLTLGWKQLQWPLEHPGVKSSSGDIALQGVIDAYTLRARADVEIPDQTDARLVLEGQGSHEALQLSHIDMQTLEGGLEGNADFSWAPQLKSRIDLRGQNFNPQGILTDWPGQLGFSLQAHGRIVDEEPTLELQQFSVHGQLRGHEVSLSSAAAYEANTTTLKQFTLSSGSTRIEVDGTLSDMLDVRWEAHSADLGTLAPGAEGQLDARGTFVGALKKPRIGAKINAHGLAYRDYRLQSLRLDADVDMAGKSESKVWLKADDGRVPGTEIRNIVLSGEGTADAHTMNLAAKTSLGDADIDLQGGLDNPGQQEMVWDFSLNRAFLKYPPLEGWSLQHPVSGQISAAESSLSASCWESGEASLCVNGRYSTQETQADFTLSDLPFSYLSHYIPPDVEIQGTLSGHGTFRQSENHDPVATLDFQTSAIRLLSRTKHKEEHGDDLIVEFQPGDLRIHTEQGRLAANMQLPLSKHDRIDIKGAVAAGNASFMQRPLDGEISTEIHNLDFIAPLLPEVQSIAGRLTGTMTVAGSLEAPVFFGRLTLSDGATEIERFGLDLRDIEIELNAGGADRIGLHAQAISAEGKLNIEGTSDLRGNTNISVKGEKFRVINTLEAQIDASPDLAIALRENRVNVDGEVVIPQAQITLKELPESAVGVSDDQVIVKAEDEGEKPATSTREIHARVRTILGDNVRFEGFGLKARIQGDILAIDKPNEPTTASGELRIVDGEYRAYGQGLVIETGRILFSGGPISQPGIDVRAVRRPREGITVGVQARGDLRKPEFSLFSEPGMTQGNQLSYLVLGRPLSGTSSSEGSALSQAALVLGLKGGNAVAEKIGGSLGLDQFGLDPGEAGSDTSPQNATFVIGKYLSPRLYISYGLGLFNETSTLRLQYTLSNHWKLVTESSNEARGADVIYEIETGK